MAEKNVTQSGNFPDVRKPDYMEQYRTTVYGEPRGDFETALAALSDQVNILAVAEKAIEGSISDFETCSDTGVLMGVHGIVRNARVTIDRAITLLEDLGVTKS